MKKIVCIISETDGFHEQSTLEAYEKSGLSKIEKSLFLLDEEAALVMDDVLNSDIIVCNGRRASSKLFGNMYVGENTNKIMDVNGSKLLFIDTCDPNLIERCFLKIVKSVENSMKKIEEKKPEPHSIKIPEKFYTEDYVLVDIQHIHADGKILYIFRDKDDKKVFHTELSSNFYYYRSSENPGGSPVFEKTENLETAFVRKKRGFKEVGTYYEEDLSVELRHSIDYYYNRKVPERPYEPKTLYWDIEVFSNGNRRFPSPILVQKPINAISFRMGNCDRVNVYVLRLPEMDKSEIKPIERVDIKVFETERDLLLGFFEKVRELDPDLMAGWNTSTFDIPYTFNRAFKLGVDTDKISPVERSHVVTNEMFKTKVFGMYFLDQLFLYKKMNAGKQEPSYKLSYIAQKNLGRGKVAYEGLLDGVYMEDINKFIEYSFTDTDLLVELEDRLSHIRQKFELVKVCSSTWTRSETTNGLVEPNALAFAKRNGLAVKNRPTHSKREKFSGAYVIPPKVGLYKWVIDLDFKALYPSIICSFNIGHNTYDAKVEPATAYTFIYEREKLPDTVEITLNPLDKSSHKTTMTKDEFINYINFEQRIISITGCVFKNHAKELSFMYRLLTDLMSMRDSYKSKMGKQRVEFAKIENKDSFEAAEIKNLIKKYDTMQGAYKILMNSFYGAIANPYFRLYNLDMAKTITRCGQEVLKYSVTHVGKYLSTGKTDTDLQYLRNFGYNDHAYVLYGDTDSMFVAIGDWMLKNRKERSK